MEGGLVTTDPWIMFEDLRDKPVDLAKLRSVRLSGSAVPTRQGRVNEISDREKRWEKDIPAYKRLRKEGLQPKRVDGSAAVEQRASERHQVEGTPSPKSLQRVSDAGF